MPSSVLQTIASSENSTIAAMSWAFLTACSCLATSRTAVMQQEVAGVDAGRADVNVVAVVREQSFRLVIDQHDRSLLVTPAQSIWDSLQQNLRASRLREHLILLFICRRELETD